MNTRNWSIRSKITALLLVPLLALVALWGFATSLTVPPALNLLDLRTTAENVSQPAEILVTELQRERKLSLVYLGGSAVLPVLDDQRARTDTAAESFRRTAGSADTRDATTALDRQRIEEMLSALNLLPSGRTFIDRREVDRSGALGLYNGIIDVAFRMFSTPTDIPDEELVRTSRGLITLGRARELLTQEDALISGAQVSGVFAVGEAGRVVQLIGMQRYQYADALAELPEADRIAYQKLTEQESFVRLRAMEDDIVAAARDGEAVPVDLAQWQAAHEAVVGQVRDFEVAQAEAVAERAQPVALGIFARLAAAGVLGLIAVIFTIVISLRLGRDLIGRLTGLRRAALDMAGKRLPEIVSRLRRGERIDVSAEAPPLEYGSDEIGQLGRAFTEVQLTAVRSAVDEAEMRQGLNDVFLNIARRSQTLLHRQLALLDKMERRASEPEELEDLFRVDHLATRMRRHAEALVILAGAVPGRGWRTPIPMIDVIRGAVSEVEDYARVTVLTVEDIAVAGRAVGDVIHLLAELIENASSFSPPHTKVRVSAQAVPNGYAVEVEDRGLGMTPEAMAEANDRLGTPPEFDPGNSARLGLFVVGKLAARHNVRVQLRPSPYGGVTAVVLLPSELVVTADAMHAPEAPQPTIGAGDPHEPIQLASRARTSPRLAAVRSRPALASVTSPKPVELEQPALTRPLPPVAEPAVEEPQPARQARSLLSGLELAEAVTETLPAVDAAPAAPVRPVPSQQPLLLSEDGLPRRVRQASLAPQLRERSEPPPPVEPPPGRTPEEIRARMSAFQSGTRRGRLDGDTLPPTGSAPSAGGAPLAGIGAPPAGTGTPGAASDNDAQAVVAGNGGAATVISLDLPFTGPPGGRDRSGEDWFNPSRKAGESSTRPAPAAQQPDPEEDA